MPAAVVPGKTKESYSTADDARRLVFGVAEEVGEEEEEEKKKFSRSAQDETDGGRKGPDGKIGLQQQQQQQEQRRRTSGKTSLGT